MPLIWGFAERLQSSCKHSIVLLDGQDLMSGSMAALNGDATLRDAEFFGKELYESAVCLAARGCGGELNRKLRLTIGGAPPAKNRILGTFWMYVYSERCQDLRLVNLLDVNVKVIVQVK